MSTLLLNMYIRGRFKNLRTSRVVHQQMETYGGVCNES